MEERDLSAKKSRLIYLTPIEKSITQSRRAALFTCAHNQEELVATENKNKGNGHKHK